MSWLSAGLRRISTAVGGSEDGARAPALRELRARDLLRPPRHPLGFQAEPELRLGGVDPVYAMAFLALSAPTAAGAARLPPATSAGIASRSGSCFVGFYG